MILLRPFAGLCNRLRVMTSAIRLARDARCSLAVVWQTDPEMNTRFSDLFCPVEGVRVYETDHLNYLQRAVFHRYNPLTYRGACWPVRTDAVACARGLRPWAISTCSEFYPNDDYSWVLPRPEILSKVKETGIGPCENLVGVHVRRTDNAEACRHSPIELFVSRMRTELEQDPETRFFVATDDDPTRDLLRREFGACILTRSKVAKREARDGVRDALVDLLLLSRCRKIFGSYWSSFSGVAAMLGKTPLEIVRKDV